MGSQATNSTAVTYGSSTIFILLQTDTSETHTEFGERTDITTFGDQDW